MDVSCNADGTVDVTTLCKSVWGSLKYGPQTLSTSELETSLSLECKRDRTTKGVPVQVHCSDSVANSDSAPCVAFFDVSTSEVTVVLAEGIPVKHKTQATRAAGVRVIQLEQDVIIESIVGAGSTVESTRVNPASRSPVATAYPGSFKLGGGVDWCEFATTASITDEEQHLGIVAGGHVAHNGVVKASGGADVNVADEVTASCRVLTTNAATTVRMMCGTADGKAVTITGNGSAPEQVMGTESILAVTARANDGILARFFVSAKQIKCEMSGITHEHTFNTNDPPIIGLQQQTIATDIGSRCCFALRQDRVVLYENKGTTLTATEFLINGMPHAYYTAFAALTGKTGTSTHPLSTYVYTGNSDGRLTAAKISHSYSTAVGTTEVPFTMSEVQLGPPITHVACCATDATSKNHVVVIVRGMEVTAYARTDTSSTPGTEPQCVGYHDVASLAIQSIDGACTLDIVDASGAHVAYTLDVNTGVATWRSDVLEAPDGKWPMVVCSGSTGGIASFCANRAPVTRAAAVVTITELVSTAYPLSIPTVGWYAASMDVTPTQTVVAGRDAYDVNAAKIGMYGFSVEQTKWSVAASYTPTLGDPAETEMVVRAGPVVDSSVIVSVSGVTANFNVSNTTWTSSATSEAVTFAPFKIFEAMNAASSSASSTTAIPEGMLLLDHERYGDDRCRVCALQVVKDAPLLRVEDAVFRSATAGADAYRRTSSTDDTVMTRTAAAISRNRFRVASVVFPSQDASGTFPNIKPPTTAITDAAWTPSSSSGYSGQINAETVDAVSMSRLGVLTAQLQDTTKADQYCRNTASSPLTAVSGNVFKHQLAAAFFASGKALPPTDSTTVLARLKECMKVSGSTAATAYQRSMWGQYNQCNVAVDATGTVTGRMSPLWCRYAFNARTDSVCYTTTQSTAEAAAITNSRSVPFGTAGQVVHVTTASAPKEDNTAATESVTCCIDENTFSVTVTVGDTAFGMDAAFADEVSEPRVLVDGAKVAAFFTVGKHVCRYDADTSVSGDGKLNIIAADDDSYTNVFVAASATKCIVVFYYADKTVCYVHTVTDDSPPARELPHARQLSCMAMHTMQGVDYLALAYCREDKNEVNISFHRVDRYINTVPCGSHTVVCEAHETSKECKTVHRLPQYQTATHLDDIVSDVGDMTVDKYKKRSSDLTTHDEYNACRGLNNVGIARELSAMRLHDTPDTTDQLSVRLAWTYFVGTEHSDTIDSNRPFQAGDKIALMPGLAALEDEVTVKEIATVVNVADTVTLRHASTNATYNIPLWRLVRYRHVPQMYTPYTNDELKFCYSFHTDELTFRLQCGDSPKGNINCAASVHAFAAEMAKSNALRDKNIHTLRFNCQGTDTSKPTLPYKPQEMGAYPWGERKTNNNYVSVLDGLEVPLLFDANDPTRTERWSDMTGSIKFLTSITGADKPLEAVSTTLARYKLTSDEFKYASRFNSLTPHAIARCVTRSLVTSPYSGADITFRIQDYKSGKLRLLYRQGALADTSAEAVNQTIQLQRDATADSLTKNKTMNEVAAFFACYLQDETNTTDAAVSFKWEKTNPPLDASEFLALSSGTISSDMNMYTFTLTVNDSVYEFVAYEVSDSGHRITASADITSIIGSGLSSTYELIYTADTHNDNGQASVVRRSTDRRVHRSCMAQCTVPAFQCVYSLVYLTGNESSAWTNVSNYDTPIDQAALAIQTECPNVFYLVREWIVGTARYTDTAFCQPLRIPDKCEKDEWCVDSMAVDDAVHIALRRIGGGTAVKLQYKVALNVQHHADALSYTIPAQTSGPTDSEIDMGGIVRSVAKKAKGPAALRLLVQAIGRQYEFQRNSDSFDLNKLSDDITETAMVVDPNNNLEVYCSVTGTGTIKESYVLGDGSNSAPLYRLRGCEVSTAATHTNAVCNAATASLRYLAPEVSRWSKEETNDDKNDTTMRPGVNGTATPNYNRLKSSTIQPTSQHFEAYNAACAKATHDDAGSEWFELVSRAQIAGTASVLSANATMGVRYMPPLPDGASNTVKFYGFRGADPARYDPARKHAMKLIAYRSDARYRPARTHEDNPTRMTEVAKAVCDRIATAEIVPITSHIVDVGSTHTVNSTYAGQFVTFQVGRETFCASATSFAATLSNTDVVQSRPIQSVFEDQLGPLFDSGWHVWAVWKALIRTPLVVEIDSECTAFVVSGDELHIPSNVDSVFINTSSTPVLKLCPEEREPISWSVDSATNSHFLALVTGPKKSGARIHILRTPNIYKMVENNGLLHFASHVALYRDAPDARRKQCVVLHPNRLTGGTYTFSTLFGACSDEQKGALRRGVLGGTDRITIAVPSAVSIKINGSTGDVDSFYVDDTLYYPDTNTLFRAWPDEVHTHGLECTLVAGDSGTRYFTNGGTGVKVALHGTDIVTARSEGAITVLARVGGTRANQNTTSSCRVNTALFGTWCATNFAGHFFPDNKFVQTGIRAVFVNNKNGPTGSVIMPFTQIGTILSRFEKEVTLQAGCILDTDIEYTTTDNPQLVPGVHRRVLYRLLKTAPKDYKLIVPATVTLSGHNITPTLMNIEGWYVVTARMLQAADMIRHEVTKVLRRTSAVTTAECCLDVTAFGEAIVDQALINIQTLDSGLHFKDRSALKLSTHQRKAAVYRIVAAITADGHGGGGSIPPTRLKNPGDRPG